MRPDFAIFLKARRRSLKKSISALSLEAGIGYFQLYALERGKDTRLPEPPKLARLAAALCVTVQELLCAAGYDRPEGAGVCDAR